MHELIIDFIVTPLNVTSEKVFWCCAREAALGEQFLDAVFYHHLLAGWVFSQAEFVPSLLSEK